MSTTWHPSASKFDSTHNLECIKLFNLLLFKVSLHNWPAKQGRVDKDNTGRENTISPSLYKNILFCCRVILSSFPNTFFAQLPHSFTMASQQALPEKTKPTCSHVHDFLSAIVTQFSVMVWIDHTASLKDSLATSRKQTPWWLQVNHIQHALAKPDHLEGSMP